MGLRSDNPLPVTGDTFSPLVFTPTSTDDHLTVCKQSNKVANIDNKYQPLFHMTRKIRKKAKYAILHSAFTKLLVINNKGKRDNFRAHLGVFIHLNCSEADYEIFINLGALSTK